MAKANKNTEPTVSTPDSPAGATAVADAPAAPVMAAQAVEFPEVTEGQVTPTGGQFDLLLEMDIPVTVMLGQAQIPVRRLMQLGPGAVVPLDKPIEAPVELYLQGSKFAEGDVVVVDNRFGIRIRQIVSGENAGSEAGKPRA
jgi:flagellar motor switch protein FliN